MKKIVFFSPFYMHPIPSKRGGGVEELMTLLLNENEKQNPEYEFYFVQKKLYGKNKKYETLDCFKNSKIVYIKYNRFVNWIIRGFNRFLKLIKINKRFSNLYYNKAYKAIKSINPDHIIFERDYDVITEKFTKNYGKDKLSFHIHTQILNKEPIDKYFGSLISVSNFISDDWKSFLGNKPEMKYYVSMNCVNEDRFNKTISHEERVKLREQYGFKNDDFIVVLCGRICEDKGTDKLIEAILPLDKSIKLLIVGSVNTTGNEKTPFLRYIQKQVIQHPDKIKATGYVNNSELYKIYQMCDLQATPSMWEEAAGLVSIEGQIAGLPQIITNSGGMPEFASKSGTIIIEKDENIVDSLSNAINKLHSDKNLCKKMSEENKIHGLEFNKARYYKDFIEILNDLTRKK